MISNLKKRLRSVLMVAGATKYRRFTAAAIVSAAAAFGIHSLDVHQVDLALFLALPLVAAWEGKRTTVKDETDKAGA